MQRRIWRAFYFAVAAVPTGSREQDDEFKSAALSFSHFTVDAVIIPPL